jgi:hypothetical protein
VSHASERGNRFVAHVAVKRIAQPSGVQLLERAIEDSAQTLAGWERRSATVGADQDQSAADVVRALDRAP